MPCQPLSDLRADFNQALRDEIEAARESGGQRYELHNGKRLGEVTAGVLYRFQLNRTCLIPDEAEVKVIRGTAQIDATVVTIQGLEIILSFPAAIGNLSGEALRMEVDLTYILEKLRLRFADHAGQSLFDHAPCKTHPPIGAENPNPLDVVAPAALDGLNQDQCEAITSSLRPGVHFIWGPPGTGKTRTVGQLAAVAAGLGRRVLLVTYSNVAVDVAALAVVKSTIADLTPGRILRVGHSRSDEVNVHPSLTTGAILRQQRPELFVKLDALKDAHALLMEAAERDEDELDRVRSEIRHQRALIKIEEDILIRRAGVVCCTLARLVTATNMADLPLFDIVILDEASMSSIPFAALAAMHSKRTVVYAGDFRQLPPIVQAETPLAERWLGRDVFDHAGITDQARQGMLNDRRVVMLRTQYRMYSQIAQAVSRCFYGGLLRTGPDVDARVAPIGEVDPYRGHRVVVLDIRRLQPRCSAELGPDAKRSSRFNPVSGLTALIVSRTVPKHYSVGIITPFRAQAQLVGAMARDTGTRDVLISTVHRFQGGEVDVVILDLTAARGMRELGQFLGGGLWESAGRLLNVAVSRPRGKLIIIEDGQFLIDRQNALDANQSAALFRTRAALTEAGAARTVIAADEFSAHLTRLPTMTMGVQERVPTASLNGALMLSPAGAHQIPTAKRQLGLYVHGSSRPRAWATQSRNLHHADIYVRGAHLHPEWNQIATRLWNAGMGTDLAFNAFVADGLRVGLDLPDRQGSGRSLILNMPSVARFIANGLGLIPPHVHLVRSDTTPPV